MWQIAVKEERVEHGKGKIRGERKIECGKENCTGTIKKHQSKKSTE
jgi:hypothetical protein